MTDASMTANVVVALVGLAIACQIARLTHLPGRTVAAWRRLRLAVTRSTVRAARTLGCGATTAARGSVATARAHRPSPRVVLIAAILVGFIVRLLWVIWATREPTEFRDGAEYLRLAADFADHRMPTFQNGDLSAFWAPGYSALLAPFVWLSEVTGWFSPAFAASLVNVAAGTATIWLTARLATAWLGPLTRNVAAWLVALCPALVYWTATAHTETVFTAVFLGAIVVMTNASSHDGSSRGHWVVAGLLAGAASLIHSPGIILLGLPIVTLRARGRPWRQSFSTLLPVLVGAALLFAPWTVRNGLQVGVWSPMSTSNATVACFGHHDDARPQFDRPTYRLQLDCYRNSPFDDRRLADELRAVGTPESQIAQLGEPDEPRWYRDTMLEAIRWAATHPVQEVRLSFLKVWETWEDEDRVVDGARNYAEPGWAGPWHGRLQWLADMWLWLVGAAAVLGLFDVRACRRALPIWVPIVAFTVAIVGGVAYPHYRYPVVPLVAILGAGWIASLRRDAPGTAGEGRDRRSWREVPSDDRAALVGSHRSALAHGVRAAVRSIGAALGLVASSVAFVVVVAAGAVVRVVGGRAAWLRHGTWVTRSPPTTPSRKPVVVDGLPPRTARPRLVTSVAFAVLLVMAIDLTAGALLAGSGVLTGERGDLIASQDETWTQTMSAPAIAAEPWAAAYTEDLLRLGLDRQPDYEPYLVWTFYPYRSTYLNTTSEERVSRRVSPEQSSPLRVAFFGGSAMFGVGQRDDHTIPSEFARLADRAGVPIEVHNFGASGWVAWQQMLYFERMASQYDGFDLAVFFDGWNDFQTQQTDFSEQPTHSGAAISQRLGAEFHREHQTPPGFLDGPREMIEAYRRNSGAYRVLQHLRHPEPTLPAWMTPDDGVSQQAKADAALAVYGRARRATEALGREYRTPVRFFWQPSRIGWSREVLDRLPAGTVDLSGVFADEDPADIYLDDVHFNERGARLVAAAMWDVLSEELTDRHAARAGQPVATRSDGIEASPSGR